MLEHVLEGELSPIVSECLNCESLRVVADQMLALGQVSKDCLGQFDHRNNLSALFGIDHCQRLSEFLRLYVGPFRSATARDAVPPPGSECWQELDFRVIKPNSNGKAALGDFRIRKFLQLFR